eukprot:365042-Chlamydomonas_euryale.AAC.14
MAHEPQREQSRRVAAAVWRRRQGMWRALGPRTRSCLRCQLRHRACTVMDAGCCHLRCSPRPPCRRLPHRDRQGQAVAPRAAAPTAARPTGGGCRRTHTAARRRCTVRPASPPGASHGRSLGTGGKGAQISTTSGEKAGLSYPDLATYDAYPRFVAHQNPTILGSHWRCEGQVLVAVVGMRGRTLSKRSAREAGSCTGVWEGARDCAGMPEALKTVEQATDK